MSDDYKYACIQMGATVSARFSSGIVAVLSLARTRNNDWHLESLLLAAEGGTATPTLAQVLQLTKQIDVDPGLLNMHSHNGRPLPSAHGLTSCNAVALFGCPEAGIDLNVLEECLPMAPTNQEKIA